MMLQILNFDKSQLVEQYHPDLNKGSGAEDKFKEISAAYEVLSTQAYCVVLIIFFPLVMFCLLLNKVDLAVMNLVDIYCIMYHCFLFHSSGN